VPILAITPSESTCRELALSWGVYPYQVPDVSTVEELFAQATRLAAVSGAALSGDLIVISAGVPIGVAGSTNLLKVERIP
jgi:pyruvate kinase